MSESQNSDRSIADRYAIAFDGLQTAEFRRNQELQICSILQLKTIG